MVIGVLDDARDPIYRASEDLAEIQAPASVQGGPRCHLLPGTNPPTKPPPHPQLCVRSGRQNPYGSAPLRGPSGPTQNGWLLSPSPSFTMTMAGRHSTTSPKRPSARALLGFFPGGTFLFFILYYYTFIFILYYTFLFLLPSLGCSFAANLPNDGHFGAQRYTGSRGGTPPGCGPPPCRGTASARGSRRCRCGSSGRGSWAWRQGAWLPERLGAYKQRSVLQSVRYRTSMSDKYATGILCLECEEN